LFINQDLLFKFTYKPQTTNHLSTFNYSTSLLFQFPNPQFFYLDHIGQFHLPIPFPNQCLIQFEKDLNFIFLLIFCSFRDKKKKKKKKKKKPFKSLTLTPSWSNSSFTSLNHFSGKKKKISYYYYYYYYF